MADQTTISLRQFFDDLPDDFKDAPCAGIAIIVATGASPRVARTMTEEHFIKLLQFVAGARAVSAGKMH